MNDHELEVTQRQSTTECDLSSFLTVKNSLKKYVSECTIIDRCNLKLEESVGQGTFISQICILAGHVQIAQLLVKVTPSTTACASFYSWF